jgi:hypothetical protein
LPHSHERTLECTGLFQIHLLYNRLVLTLPRWQARDTFIALALSLSTATFTLWHNAHVGVLWDLAYLLDSSYRFSIGQVPYRDLPFAHAPLTFLIQAAIIHLFGRVYWHTIAYAALANGLATLLTWRIALRLMPGRWLLSSLLCTALVPLGIYSIYPHPIYDSDCILSVLFALYLILGTPFMSSPTALGAPFMRCLNAHERDANNDTNDSPIWNPFLAGAACVLPLFFKQNIGLIFLATTFACMLAITIAHKLRRQSIAPQLAFFTGTSLTLATATLTLHLTVGLRNYLYWTITFAAQRRLPGLSLILGTYHQPSLLWTIPTSLAALLLLTQSFSSRPERAARSGETRIPSLNRWKEILALILLAAPFLYATLNFFLADDPSDRTDALLSLWPHLLLLAIAFALFQLRRRPSITTLLPIILLATIHATFLSQQLWGSTYALWPLLVLLLALMLPQLRSLTTPITLIIAAVFLICGTLYALGHDRLSYSHINPDTDGPIAHATLPSLRGLATPGPYLPAFEQLVRITDTTIPANEGIILLPGQEPFYFATGRTPQFPVLLLDPATNPYSPTQLRDEARSRNIQWLIVNTQLQLTADPVPNLPDYILVLQHDFTPIQTLDGYTIYHRIP